METTADFYYDGPQRFYYEAGFGLVFLVVAGIATTVALNLGGMEPLFYLTVGIGYFVGGYLLARAWIAIRYIAKREPEIHGSAETKHQSVWMQSGGSARTAWCYLKTWDYGGTRPKKKSIVLQFSRHKDWPIFNTGQADGVEALGRGYFLPGAARPFLVVFDSAGHWVWDGSDSWWIRFLFPSN